MKWYVLAGIGILGVAALALWYISRPPISPSNPPKPPAGEVFAHDGVVIKDNPGFKPGVWYLSYEEPGSPGLSVALDLNAVPAPYIYLEQGKSVHVEGTLEGSVVIVRSIVDLSAKN